MHYWKSPYKFQRIEDCRRLYAKYGGRQHEQIELEMRRLGHRDFHRRILYSRFARGKHSPGWIEKYNFDAFAAAGYDTARDLAPRHYASESERDAIAALDSRGISGPGDAPPRVRKPQKSFDEFHEWLKLIAPGYKWDFRHQVYLYKKLRGLTDGEYDRLMINMPPRHGKSETVTVRYTAWLLREDPSKNVILASYNQQLANRFSRKIKGVLADDWALSRLAQKGQEGFDNHDIPVKEGSQQARESRKAPGGNAQNSRTPASLQNSHDAGSPFPFASKRRANTDAEWETSLGGGLRAVGVGSGVTGFGADFIIIDDPIKSRAEAESPVYRDSVWNWYKDDICTRLEPDGKVCVIQTRWHEDDLCGRILREAAETGEHWEVINLAAIAEGGTREPSARSSRRRASSAVAEPEKDRDKQSQSPAPAAKARVIGYPRLYSRLSEPPAIAIDPPEPIDEDTSSPPANSGDTYRPDPLGRAPGEALWPERYPEKRLDRLRLQLGTYSFSSLYQQRPAPADGGLFKRDWFKIIPHAPPGLLWRRATDPGLTSSKRSDYTASFRVAFDAANNLYIDGGFRKQLEYPELRRFILGRIQCEPDTIEHGIERSAHGRALEQDLGREPSLKGKPLVGVDIREGKVPRALPWIALAEQGKLYLVRGNWNRDLIDECLSFPVGTHDDQIDAISLGVQMSRRTNNALHRF